MAISFNQIPVDNLTPGQFAEIDNSKAVGGIQAGTQRALIIGQKLPAGEKPAAEAVQIVSSADAEAYFGRGSQIAEMISKFTEANKYQELWAIALDDAAAAVAATSQMTLGGTTSESATLHLMVAGFAVNVAVEAGETLEELALKVADEINANDLIPVTAARDVSETQKVNITARHKGECGNDIDLRVNYYTGQRLPKGLTIAFDAMAGGTTNPNITEAIAAFGATHYHHIVMPYTDAANLTALDTELEKRYTDLDAKQSSAYAVHKGTLSENAAFGNALNSKHLSILAVPSVPDMPCIWAAEYAARISAAATNDPARPYQTLALNVKAPLAGTEYTRSEQNTLLRAGMATFTANAGQVAIQRAVTTYKTNASGIEDPSYRDLNTLHTLSYVRSAVTNRIALKYPRHKLADDGTRFAAGQAIVTPQTIRVEMIALYRELEELGIVEGMDQYKKDLLVERSSQDPNRIDVIMPPNLVNQFRQFAAKIEFRL